jgi:hypothetical protein
LTLNRRNTKLSLLPKPFSIKELDMKKLMFVLTFFLCTASFAAIDFVVTPTEPVLIHSDFEYIDQNGFKNYVQGPWARVGVTVTNNTSATIEITGYRIFVGQRSFQKGPSPKQGIVLFPGNSYSTHFYLDNLPKFYGEYFAAITAEGYMSNVSPDIIPLASTHFTIQK